MFNHCLTIKKLAKMSITSKFVLRDRKNQDKTQSVQLRVILDRKSFYINTIVRVEVRFWDSKNGCVKQNHTCNSSLNAQLNEYQTKLNTFVAKSMMDKLPVNAENMKFLFAPVTEKPKADFYAFIEKYLDGNALLILKPNTLKNQRHCLKCLKEFAPKLTIEGITVEFLTKYELFLKTKEKNHTNTIHSKLKFIRTYINLAIKQGLIDKYVFKSYKLKHKSTMPKFLTPEEFHLLEKFFKDTTVALYKKHLQYFLFACVTGLRYTDLKQLSWNNIEDNKVFLRMEKTGQTISIPITRRTLQYMPEKSTGLIFKIPANQCANRFLKDIGTQAGLVKKLSCHVARHTFATISLDMDMPLSVVQKLLGHASSKTTEIYAKIIDKKLETEMMKWDAN